MIHILLKAAGAILLLFIAVLLSDWIALGFFRVRRKGVVSAHAPAEDAPAEGALERGPSEGRTLRRGNFMERQKGESCGGYSAAYVLRHFGFDVTGDEVYSGMTKVWKGRVWVREVRKQLARHGLKTGYWRGDPEILRRELDKGDPVILVVNTTVSALTLHFVAAAGYGDGVFFIADSAKPVVNYGRRNLPPVLAGKAQAGELPPGVCINGPFNRVVTEKELLDLWDTGSVFMPFHRFTYITAEKRPVSSHIFS